MLELLRHTQAECQLQNYLFTLLMCMQHTVNHVLNKLTSRSCYSIIYKYHNQSINQSIYCYIAAQRLDYTVMLGVLMAAWSIWPTSFL